MVGQMVKNMNPGVYILQSLKNTRYYVGSTADKGKRLLEHNAGKVKATRLWCPFVMKAFISCSSITEAKRSELRLKRYKSRKVLEKVIKDLTFPWDYNGRLAQR